ncbi:hypothetical protein [Paenibacillus sp. MBLB4367]|uniref:hypothetical protein n=1 Tax=Paenibacillus sp. MBLB4367 TaxID=3384767 RepID=UPI0039083486
MHFHIFFNRLLTIVIQDMQRKVGEFPGLCVEDFNARKRMKAVQIDGKIEVKRR